MGAILVILLPVRSKQTYIICDYLISDTITCEE